MIAHTKAAKVGKGRLVIWDGLLVCGPTSSRMRGTSKSARSGRVGMDIPHSRDTLSRALFMVGFQEAEMIIKKNSRTLRMSAVGE